MNIYIYKAQTNFHANPRVFTAADTHTDTVCDTCRLSRADRDSAHFWLRGAIYGVLLQLTAVSYFVHVLYLYIDHEPAHT